MASPGPDASIYVDEYLLHEKLERELLPSHLGESTFTCMFTVVHFLACLQRYKHM